jgi:hypothetical protein
MLGERGGHKVMNCKIVTKHSAQGLRGIFCSVFICRSLGSVLRVIFIWQFA